SRIELPLSTCSSSCTLPLGASWRRTLGYSASVLICFFFNDTPTTEIYTLSLHDALPIFAQRLHPLPRYPGLGQHERLELRQLREDRKSTRLNSSHVEISYAVFCLKKKNTAQTLRRHLLRVEARTVVADDGQLAAALDV